LEKQRYDSALSSSLILIRQSTYEEMKEKKYPETPITWNFIQSGNQKEQKRKDDI
jgi:hypothetical protein